MKRFFEIPSGSPAWLLSGRIRGDPSVSEFMIVTTTACMYISVQATRQQHRLITIGYSLLLVLNSAAYWLHINQMIADTGKATARPLVTNICVEINRIMIENCIREVLDIFASFKFLLLYTLIIFLYRERCWTDFYDSPTEANDDIGSRKYLSYY